MTDWFEWHQVYDDPTSRFAARRAKVHRAVEEFLDRAPPGPIVALDVCAGQARELVPVLARHPRGADVEVVVVELDPRNADAANAAATSAGVASVTVRTADAGCSDTYDGLPRADLVVMSGVLIHLRNRDLARVIRRLPELCASDATFVWTRKEDAAGRRVRRLLQRHGFAIIRVDRGGQGQRVGTARMTCAPRDLVAGRRWFTFGPVKQTRRNKARVALGRYRRRLLPR